jgi:hypothetical protein
VFYLFSVASQDEEAQKKGVVFIYNAIGQQQFFVGRGPKIIQLTQVLPIKITSLHCYYDNPMFHGVLSASAFMLPQLMVPRTRFQCGTFLFI